MKYVIRAPIIPPEKVIPAVLNSNTPVLYLRGGGRYYISTSFTCTWTPRTSTYTVNEQSVSPVTSRPTPKGININESNIYKRYG